MIEIEKLDPGAIGQWVVYIGGAQGERGRIKSWNDEVIFVIYGPAAEADDWHVADAKATNPIDLVFEADLAKMAPAYLNNVTVTGRDKQDKVTLKANIKQNTNDFVVFTVSSPKPLTYSETEKLGTLYRSLIHLAEGTK
jgi:hypothetical protein